MKGRGRRAGRGGGNSDNRAMARRQAGACLHVGQGAEGRGGGRGKGVRRRGAGKRGGSCNQGAMARSQAGACLETCSGLQVQVLCEGGGKAGNVCVRVGCGTCGRIARLRAYYSGQCCISPVSCTPPPYIPSHLPSVTCLYTHPPVWLLAIALSLPFAHPFTALPSNPLHVYPPLPLTSWSLPHSHVTHRRPTLASHTRLTTHPIEVLP